MFVFRADSGPAGRQRQGVSCWVLLGQRARAGNLVIKLMGERLQGTVAPVPSPPVLPSEVRLRTLIKAPANSDPSSPPCPHLDIFPKPQRAFDLSHRIATSGTAERGVTGHKTSDRALPVFSGHMSGARKRKNPYTEHLLTIRNRVHLRGMSQMAGEEKMGTAGAGGR